jgi:hypothetical protein
MNVSKKKVKRNENKPKKPDRFKARSFKADDVKQKKWKT